MLLSYCSDTLLQTALTLCNLSMPRASFSTSSADGVAVSLSLLLLEFSRSAVDRRKGNELEEGRDGMSKKEKVKILTPKGKRLLGWHNARSVLCGVVLAVGVVAIISLAFLLSQKSRDINTLPMSDVVEEEEEPGE